MGGEADRRNQTGNPHGMDADSHRHGASACSRRARQSGAYGDGRRTSERHGLADLLDLLDDARRGEIHPALFVENAAAGTAPACGADALCSAERKAREGRDMPADWGGVARAVSHSLRHDHPAYVFIGIRGFRARGQYVSLLCAACDADCPCDEPGADEGKEARCAGEQTRESYLLCVCRSGVCPVHFGRTAPPLSEAHAYSRARSIQRAERAE